MHMHKLDPLYKSYGPKKSSGVIWGHWGQKFIFTKICYNSSMLHSMTIRLIHVYQLLTLYLCYGVKCQSGVNWGHRVKNIFFTQNILTHPIYSVYSCNLCKLFSLRPSTTVMGSEFNLGSRGVIGAQIMILHNAHKFYLSFFRV